jgi:uncharacterized protein YbjT (DUF2867 family)
MNKKAVLAGATGLTGKECLNLLLSDDFYSEVEIWVRKSTGITHPKLSEKIVDFDKIAQMDCTHIDHFFCCLGTTIKKAKSQANFYKIDHDFVLDCAKIAEKYQSEKFLYISSLGANKDSGNFYLRTKGQVEESLKQLIIPHIIIFRPSMLLGNRAEFRLVEKIGKAVMTLIQFMLIGSMRKYRGVQASQVAIAMVEEAKSSVNKGFRIIESDKIQEY